MEKDKTSGLTEQSCFVCYKEVVFYSVGVCEHSVCFECSARMRALLSQNECPICRQELEHVMFTKGNRSYKDMKDRLRMFIFDPRYHIYIETNEIKQQFEKLLEARCKFCKDTDENSVFKDFAALRLHVQRNHNVFSCDLCVEHIKLFPVERRFYNRSDLARHRRDGDKDNTSFRGHPLCRFCDKRYFDDDDLFKHLRRDHYFCHFCDADGLNHFYNTYDDLRVHFRCEHFLCEEENCKEERFTSVFRTKIDLKAHQASVHSRLLGKHGVKQARQLDVEFNLPPRGDPRRNRDHRDRHAEREIERDREATDNSHGDHVSDSLPTPASREVVQVPSKPKINLAEFPTLDGQPAASTNTEDSGAGISAGTGSMGPGTNPATMVSKRIALSNGLNVSSKKNDGPSKSWSRVSGANRLEHEFPALVSESTTRAGISGGYRTSHGGSSNGKSFNTAATKGMNPPAPRKNPEVRSGQAMLRSEDFPDLPSTSARSSAPSAWTGQAIKPKKGQGKVPAPAPVLPGRSGNGPLSNGHSSQDDTLRFVPLSYGGERNKRGYLPKKS